MAPQVRSLRACFNARLQILYTCVPDSADPVLLPSSSHWHMSWLFLSTRRVAGTEHMLAARYDMMVAQPRCREEAMNAPRGAWARTHDVFLSCYVDPSPVTPVLGQHFRDSMSCSDHFMNHLRKCTAPLAIPTRFKRRLQGYGVQLLLV
jgi:hypothetical protein